MYQVKSGKNIWTTQTKEKAMEIQRELLKDYKIISKISYVNIAEFEREEELVSRNKTTRNGIFA